MYGNGNGQVGPGRREPIFGTGSLFGARVKRYSDFSRANHERILPEEELRKGNVAPSPIERESNIKVYEPTADWLAHTTQKARDKLKNAQSSEGRRIIEKEELKTKLLKLPLLEQVGV